MVDLALSKEAAYLVAHIDIRVLLRARMEHSRPPIHPAACTLLPSRRQTGLDASAPTETPTLHLRYHKTPGIGLDVLKKVQGVLSFCVSTNTHHTRSFLRWFGLDAALRLATPSHLSLLTSICTCILLGIRSVSTTVHEPEHAQQQWHCKLVPTEWCSSLHSKPTPCRNLHRENPESSVENLKKLRDFRDKLSNCVIFCTGKIQCPPACGRRVPQLLS